MIRRPLLAAMVALGVLASAAADSSAQTAPPKEPAPADKPADAPSAADAGGFTIEIELVEEKKVREELVKKVEKLPPVKQTQANDELKWAAQQMEFAAAELAKARAEKSDVVRQVHLREAMDKIELARTYARRVESELGLPPRDGSRYLGAAAPSTGGIQTGDSPALRQLRTSAILSNQDKTAGAFGERDLGRLSEVAGYDPRSQTVVLPNGQRMTVAPLQKAVNGADKSTQGQPLFQKIDIPGQQQPVWRLTPAARAALHNPARRAAIDKLGGVDLKITFDVLSFAGISDFRPKGPATVVNQPVLVSLRRLLEKAEQSVRSAGDWDVLADDVRYPGSIDRLHGFVLVPGDLVLVGERATMPANRISLDVLMVGLKAVWKEGKAPGVSLDRRPGSESDVRFARVENVPFQTRFARIMLEADYAMKHVDRLAYAKGLGEFGRRSLAIDREERPKIRALGPPYSSERQWLTPAPLRPADLYVSGSGRSVLFASGVQRQSETKRSGIRSALASEQLYQRQTELFNKFYPSFEQEPAIEPNGVFRRMHGLVDIAVLGYVLAEAGVASHLLDRLIGLPLPELRGKERVPTTYTSFDIDHPEFPIITTTGGARLRVRPKPRDFDLVNDAASLLLERAVDRFVTFGGIATTVDLPLTLPQGNAFPEFMVDRRLEAALNDAEAKRFDQAAAKLRELATLAPLDERVWAQLGLVEARRQRIAESNAAVAKALALAPTDPDVRALALKAALERGPTTLEEWPPAVRFELAWEFTLRARDFLARGDKAAAAPGAAAALTLWPDHAEAALIFAMSVDPLSEEAVAVRAHAIELYRKAQASDPSDDNRRNLAFALSSSVAWEIEAITREMPRWSQLQADAARRRQAFRVTYRMIDELREAAEMDPDNPLAPAIHGRLLMLQQMLAQLAGLSGNFREALQTAVMAVQKFPGFAEAHLSHAQILLQLGRIDDALLAVNNAVNLDAGFANALMLRAAIFAEQRRCDLAGKDLQRIRNQWGPPANDVTSFVEQRCR